MSKREYRHIKSGFKAPDDYFDSLDKKLMDKIQASKAIEPKIASGFKVPDNYFETFKPKISKPKVITWQRVTYLSGIAAAILILLNIFVTPTTPSIEDLETATIENYLLNESYGTSELASLFSDEELSDSVNLSLDEEQLEEYLLENTTLENLIDY